MWLIVYDRYERESGWVGVIVGGCNVVFVIAYFKYDYLTI